MDLEQYTILSYLSTLLHCSSMVFPLNEQFRSSEIKTGWAQGLTQDMDHSLLSFSHLENWQFQEKRTTFHQCSCIPKMTQQQTHVIFFLFINHKDSRRKRLVFFMRIYSFDASMDDLHILVQQHCRYFCVSNNGLSSHVQRC